MTDIEVLGIVWLEEIQPRSRFRLRSLQDWSIQACTTIVGSCKVGIIAHVNQFVFALSSTIPRDKNYNDMTIIMYLVLLCTVPITCQGALYWLDICRKDQVAYA